MSEQCPGIMRLTGIERIEHDVGSYVEVQENDASDQ
jgi:hypothetical protein